MRDPGVEFLGEVPSHWDVQPAVTLARVLTSTVDKKSYEGEQSVRLCNYTDVYYSDQIVDSSNFMVATATSEQIAKFSVRAGDVPFTKDSETADDIGIPSYVPKDLPRTVYGYHLSIFRPIDKRRGRFLKYLLESDYAKAYFEAKTPGVTRVGLGQATIRYFRAPTPPVEEAVAIADYLDRETAQIDAFIAKNDELITLLTERRASVIREATTVGLGTETELVESGLAGVGPISSDWRVMRLSWLFRTTGSGTTPPSELMLDGEEADVWWVTTGELRERTITSTSKGISADTLAATSALKIHPAGSLLIAMYGATIGRMGVLGVPAASNQAVCALSNPVGCSVEFVEYAMLAARERLLLAAVGGGQPNINQETVRAFRIPVPALDEQRAIVQDLRERIGDIDSAIAAAGSGIELARERRAALISAAVTGKIDVGVAV